MSAAIKDVIELIEYVAPKELQYEWDNTGIIVKCSDSVDKILIALDVTDEVIKEAVECGCDMILTHHPLIFSAMKSLSFDEYPNSLVMELIKNGISLYSAHTSYDRAQGGMNDMLAERLGLIDVKTIGGAGEELMRMGELENAINANELAELVKEKLGSECVKLSDEDYSDIKKAAVIGGSGANFVFAAKQQGADVLITGEAKHNNFLEAKDLGILLIDAGHYETEQIFANIIFSGLQSRLDEVQLHLGLKIADSVCAPYSVV